MKNIINYNEKFPKIHSNVFVAKNSMIIGDVEIKDFSSIWFGTQIRADENSIKIGKYANIQDACILHVSEKSKVLIKDYVTIGHGAIIHGCQIESNCLIGMGSIIMDNVFIDENCIIGAGSLLLEGVRTNKFELWVGRPAKFIKKLEPSSSEVIKQSALKYSKRAEDYLNNKN